ncbi:MAG: NBR1-Ig-like domain-containing protein [Anaerolineales bacterium]|nr:NBR1-Ig-like domain-containing protein [Anaerolineales bacterium]
MRTRIAFAFSLTAGPAILASCNLPRSPSPQQAAQTAVAEANSAQLTQGSLATPFLPSTNTPTPPSATNTPTPSPQPTTTVGCDDSSQFISDVTIPDNTVMTPGQSFTKTWRLRNSGNCDWTTSFDAVFTDGSSMGGPADVPLAGTVPPNSTIDISINLTAPTTNGVHRGNYRMANASDILFGTLIYVQIVVGPTPTPNVAVYRTGKLTIDNGGSIDFDGVDSVSGSRRDVRVKYVSDSERYLEPTNGALLKEMSGKPSYDDCKETSLRSGAVNFTDFSTQSYFCYKTSDGRYGRFQVGKIEGDSIAVDFRTWD